MRVPRTDWVLASVFEFYYVQLNDCLRKIFGEDWEKIGEVNVWNAPLVNADLSKGQIGNMTATPGDKSGMPGENVIFIASDLFTQNRAQQIRKTYIHELGNFLDFKINSVSSEDRQNVMKNYGDPQHPIDQDTGQALEDCVFAKWPNI